jgi:quercetin dioxygenase-like cupin family protein
VAESTTSRVLVTNDVMRVVQCTVDGTEHAMGEGDVIHLAPGAPHAWVAETACRMTLVMVELPS